MKKADEFDVEALMTKLCLESSLYASENLRDDPQGVLSKLRKDNFQIDAHCVLCEKEVVFKTTRRESPEDTPTRFRLNRLPIQADFFCQRKGHRYSFFFLSIGNDIAKVGQFPSTEDIASADINKYRSVLDKEHFANLRRAGGLNSHGIGIGAFVYLRRIFEKLIQQHREELEKRTGPIEAWDRMRVADRIEALKAVLPRALVEHSSTYSILSQGVHELDEATCLKHFPVVRAAIILMLEQDLQNLERQRAEDDLRREMATVTQELAGSADALAAKDQAATRPEQ